MLNSKIILVYTPAIPSLRIPKAIKFQWRPVSGRNYCRGAWKQQNIKRRDPLEWLAWSTFENLHSHILHGPVSWWSKLNAFSKLVSEREIFVPLNTMIAWMAVERGPSQSIRHSIDPRVFEGASFVISILWRLRPWYWKAISWLWPDIAITKW